MNVAKRKALIVRGGWPGHSPVAATDRYIRFLEEDGFHVIIESTPEIYADANAMAEVDLVLQSMTQSEIDRPQVRGLAAAVEAGTGLAGWHGGIVDSYRADVDYLHLLGGQFAHHASRMPRHQMTPGEQSNFYTPYTVELTELGQQHPITAGLPDFSLDTELYWVLSDAYNDVLATVTQPVRQWDAWDRPVTSPAIWTRRWGRGRIFVCTPGHDLNILSNPHVDTIVRRGLLWAARGSDMLDVRPSCAGG